MPTLADDVRFGIRSLLSHRGFALSAIFTLALGVGANTAMFSVGEAALLRPLPFPDSDRIVRVGESADAPGRFQFGWLTHSDWKARSHSFETMAAYRTPLLALSGQQQPEQLLALSCTYELMPLLGVQPQRGRLFRQDEDQPGRNRVALISESLWQRRFQSDPDIVGRKITLNEQPYEVIGVLPASFRPAFAEDGLRRADLVTPLGYGPAFRDACRTCRHLRGMAKLRPDVTVEQARQELAGILQAMAQDDPATYGKGRVAVVRPLREVLLGDLRRPVMMLLAAGGLVLLVACCNMSNLLLLRAVKREREMAVRAALGASRRQLLRQFLVESLLLSVAGSVAGILMALWTAPAIVSAAPYELQRYLQVDLNPAVLAASFAVTLLSGLAAGCWPGWQTAKSAVSERLKEGSRGTAGRRTHRFRDGLVIAEIGTAFVLLFLSALLLQSLARLLSVEPGFNADQVLTASVNSVSPRYPRPEDDVRFFSDIVASLQTQPRVVEAAAVSVLPISRNFDQIGIRVPGQEAVPPSELPMADRYVVTQGYFRTMRIQLREGRLFGTEDSATAPKVAILNESGARRLFLHGDAVGQRIKVNADLSSPWATVVGIVGDVRQYGLDVEPATQVYLTLPQEPRGYMTLVMRSGMPREPALASIRKAVASVDPTRALSDVATMSEWIAESLRQRRFTLLLLSLYGGLALALALVGIYGLLSFAVAQQRREIGIRLAVGATAREVQNLILGQAGKLVLAGLSGGLIAAVFLGAAVRTLLFQTAPYDLRVMGCVVIAVVAVSLLASGGPAWRAARTDPAQALLRE